jgi:2'-5' RNA ligase
MLRLFFALQPTAALGADLLERAAPLAARTDGQSVPAENFHATLCFVGAVAPEKLYLLLETASRVRCAPVTLLFDAFEYWDKPRILCATAAAGAAESAANRLSRDLGEAAIAAGFAPDVKPFRPHFTLARKLSAAEAGSVEWPQPLEPALAVRCEQFVLMRSQRVETGSLYSVVETWPLDGIEPL